MFCNLKYLFYFCKRFQKRVLKLIVAKIKKII